MLTSFELVLIKGHKDTRVKSGQSYDTITLAEIAQMAEVPNRLCKLDAPALSPQPTMPQMRAPMPLNASMDVSTHLFWT